MASKRLQKELLEMEKDSLYSVMLGDGDDLSLWIVQIPGPEGSPYEGGIFNLEIRFPKDYPIKPPQIQFTTRIFHPNINKNGTFCLEMLKNCWDSSTTTSRILLAVSSLLNEPNPDSALLPEIAEMYKNNKEEFEKQAKLMTKKFATG